MIDLRSDVMTLPTEGMLRAMTTAPLGDEQVREDPTVRALEDDLTGMLGQEAAVFVPSATMANQIAMLCQVERGQEIVGERHSHMFRYEAGGPAFLAGAVVTGLPGTAGVFTGAQVRATAQVGDSEHRPRTALALVEDTHNVSGGRAWPTAALDDLYDTCDELGLAVHIDGARLFNASVALDVPPDRITARARTVAVCFSKGLGCPAGAALVGRADVLAPARRIRQMLGGSLRQAGVLAGAARYALRHNIARLADDHANARTFATLLAEGGLPVDPADVDTNFVFLDVASLGLDRGAAQERLRSHGVLWSNAHHPGVLRAVTFLGRSEEDVRTAAARTVKALTTA
ncbi:threonine aldolase family protein [Actinomadura chibensis]|uniref:Low specificity L-threonine aldolase n=1 Tax=Actinomadura chibensis TaxID=392828 RepID=A0A5D0NDA2_9ACTN|nr:GntG family PLP-dependent aldolase [Actinomadura chibensis]TYB42259.1 low specificity L-threonine aldolase [Actinomadura chibensis]